LDLYEKLNSIASLQAVYLQVFNSPVYMKPRAGIMFGNEHSLWNKIHPTQ